jgi:hypothetical protein
MVYAAIIVGIVLTFLIIGALCISEKGNADFDSGVLMGFIITFFTYSGNSTYC